MTESDVRIGLRIKMIREQLGMSQEELAHKIGYKSKSSINKIELGIQGLTQSKIKKIADALQTVPGDIMGWADEVPQMTQPCELFEQCYGKEAFAAVKMFVQLDQIDQTKITTRMEVMLEGEKYALKKESKHA